MHSKLLMAGLNTFLGARLSDFGPSPDHLPIISERVRTNQFSSSFLFFVQISNCLEIGQGQLKFEKLNENKTKRNVHGFGKVFA